MQWIFTDTFSGIGGFVQRPKTEPTGNEMVVQSPEAEDDAQTKFYKQHMKRNLPPSMADRTATRDFDDILTKQTSESFREKQRWLATEGSSAEDFRTLRQNQSNVMIAIGITIFLAFAGQIFWTIESKKFNKMIEENKEKKSS